MTGELVRYDAMCQAIAEAHKVDEVKDIHDRAAALELYARIIQNTEAENQCREIRIRAADRAGVIWRQQKKAKGGRPKKTPPVEQGVCNDVPTIADLGLTYNQSADWQKLSTVPRDVFEAAIANGAGSVTEILNIAYPPKPLAVSDDALWLWGRLCEFERHDVFDTDPQHFLETMVPHMLETVYALAPQLAAWLSLFGEGSNGAFNAGSTAIGGNGGADHRHPANASDDRPNLGSRSGDDRTRPGKNC